MGLRSAPRKQVELVCGRLKRIVGNTPVALRVEALPQAHLHIVHLLRPLWTLALPDLQRTSEPRPCLPLLRPQPGLAPTQGITPEPARKGTCTSAMFPTRPRTRLSGDAPPLAHIGLLPGGPLWRARLHFRDSTHHQLYV